MNSQTAMECLPEITLNFVALLLVGFGIVTHEARMWGGGIVLIIIGRIL